ncbi:MAG: dihydropteroate synthase [Anaerolineales bacterium]|nr:dihydropteroate synthase [Anaerolineales bacterium]MCB9128939.1 dihydropteroate synthase [Ardenticatenales bacterium]MCB9172828.1 dihydropteroate synthase [Ardenticatenales bacterium]
MRPPLVVGPLTLHWGRQSYIMGIINTTPDSFSGDGLLNQAATVEAALTQARRFVAEGAHILDVGGESTRPGSVPVSADEEMDRVLPVIRAISNELAVAISIDSYHAEVAEAALAAGAHMLNDVWGARMDPRMAALAAERGVPIVLMHNRMRPKQVSQEERLGGRFEGVQYDDLLGDVARELIASVEIVRGAGVRSEQIILDPGLGFGKTVPQSLELLDRLNELRVLGYPILLGPSRKSFIGYTLDLPPQARVEGTAATVAIGIARGADILRVHDVQAMARVARMTDAIIRRSRKESA